MRTPLTVHRRRRLGIAAAAAALLLPLAACSDDAADRIDPEQVDAVEPPELGACRMLTPEDVGQSSNATKTVDCAEPHTAETYAIGTIPDEVAESGYTSEKLGLWAYQTCAAAFEKFLGANESLVMRSVVSWAWFRPSEKAWADGARWYRCDIVGGGDQAKSYVNLPETAKGLLSGQPPDDWMVCAQGESVVGSVKVPCAQDHDWRAVTTIVIGKPEDPYPGDRLVEVRSRDYCSDSVGAWMNYPVDYDYAYTWFHEPEWKAGNRRSICWARTSE
ncbi:septum formation family protein [Nocardioides sp. AE5]|uniref:septum formation family protein n=1 Tax=Nocardioides sp. AE5 TaxID=2962573 RepID=UPI002880E604|nr:septum formation family protein [Nocardioides sp. AE5]MDT0203281.1 septum formation family protein [Nocardioides sp. AE5]